MIPPDSTEQQANKDANHEGGVITALIDSVTQILQRYSIQWKTSKEILHLEWIITRKSLWFALVLLIIFSGIVFSACIALTGLVAYALYLQAVPIWAIAITLISLHGVALFALVHMMRSLVRGMGFHRSVAILRAPQLAIKDTKNTVDTGKEESASAV